MRRSLIALILAAIAATPSASTEYVQHDGYYWNGNKAYVQHQYYHPGYYNCGYYYQPYYTYEYTYDHTYTPPSNQVTYGPNWKSEVIKAAAEQDDRALFWETINKLGLNGQMPGYRQYGYSYSNYQPSGATQYGYSYKQVVDFTNLPDLTVPLQQASKYLQNSQETSKEGFSLLNGTLNNIGERQAEIARTIAEGQVRNALLEKLVQGSQLTPHAHLEVEKGGGGGLQSIAPSGMTDDQFAQLRAARCGSCHGAKDPKGSLDMTKAWSSYSPQQKATIIERLITTDLSKHMPRGADGKPADLPASEKVEFVRRGP